nr:MULTISPECIES: hypothetical protein [Nocardia]
MPRSLFEPYPQVQFATKPRLVMAMLERAVSAKVPFRWFTADEAYGQVK